MKPTTINQHIKKLTKARSDIKKIARAYVKVVGILQPFPPQSQLRILRAARIMCKP